MNYMGHTKEGQTTKYSVQGEEKIRIDIAQECQVKAFHQYFS